jgi:hypothetical protein
MVTYYWMNNLESAEGRGGGLIEFNIPLLTWGMKKPETNLSQDSVLAEIWTGDLLDISWKRYRYSQHFR